MQPLFYLFWLQSKASVRRLFSKPSSAIFTLLLIIFYGGILIYSLCSGNIALSIGNLTDINTAILINLGFSALMIFTMMLQKKISLLFENDAFYLFTGPFKRSHIMAYLMFSTVLSALLFGAINVVMMIFLSMGLAFSLGFLLLLFFVQALLYFFFLALIYYNYLLSLTRKDRKSYARLLALLLLGSVALLFLWLLLQQDLSFAKAMTSFINSPLFYWVPLFGWAKLVLVGHVAGQVGQVILGCGLLIAAAIGSFLLMISYKKDFIEEVMQDAAAFTKRYQQIREGKQSSFNDRKIRTVHVRFHDGAGAILSKNLLIMRKTNEFIRFHEVLTLSIYLLVTLLMDLDFTFYSYMLILWLFTILQNSDFMQDMNNYQLYLIPEPPFKKLLYTLGATMLKLTLLLSVAIIIGAILLKEEWLSCVYTLFLLLGYMVLLMSATVLSLRILKSRSTSTIESLLRMLIMLIAALPGIGILILAMVNGWWSPQWMLWITLGNLLINFIIAFILLFLCRNMMNGRELASE